MNDYIPDWFELNDWMLTTHPKEYSATKYLSSNEAQHKIWMIQWETDGRPKIV